MRVLFLIAGFLTALLGGEDLTVKISKDLPYFYTYHKGVKVKVFRIQDVANELSDDYIKTSRECPPFCIHPIKAEDGVETIGELEFIEYMRKKDSLVVDARLRSWYILETIPSAINIPYDIFESEDETKIKKILKALGRESDGSYKNPKRLLIFCNGIWCDQSPRLIKNLIKYGYPKDRLKYYRDGMQGWKLLGLTTVVEKENKN